jgi:hypothetical protein
MSLELVIRSSRLKLVAGSTNRLTLQLTPTPRITVSTVGVRSSTGKLLADTDYWLDADDGDDTADGSEATPWQTLERAAEAIAEYEELRATLRFFLVKGVFTWQPLTVPLMIFPQPVTASSGGKIVFIGGTTSIDQTVTVSAVVNDYTFDVTGTYAIRDGWMIEGVTGPGALSRRGISYTADNGNGTWRIEMTAPLTDTPVIGNTFRIYRPTTEIAWDGYATLAGPGRAPLDPNGIDQGVYFVNLRYTGTPYITGINCWWYGVEHDSNQPIGMSDGTYGAGLVAASMPWIDDNAGLWQGLGLTQRKVSDATLWLAIQSLDSIVTGYFCGTAWQALDYRARFSMYGGSLWGAEGLPTLEASDGARVDVGAFSGAVPPRLSSAASGADLPAVIYAHGAATVIRIGKADISADGAPLVLSTDAAQVTFSADFGQVTGTGGGIGCKVASLGRIAWHYAPTLTAATELTAEGSTSSFAAGLATSPSVFANPALSHSFVARSDG